MDWTVVAGIAAVTALVGAGAAAALSKRLTKPPPPPAMMASGVPIGCIQHLGDGNWLVNDAAEAFLRLPCQKVCETDAVVAAVDEGSREAFQHALTALVQSGKSFEIAGRSAGHTLHFVGLPGEESGSTVWIQDTSATTWLAEQFAEKETKADVLEAVINAVPIPVWWRDAENLDVIGANKAYQERFGETAPTPEGTRARDLARLAQRTGVPQNESRALVMEGLRRSYDFSETPLAEKPGYLAGSATDVSALEELQSTLAEHIAVQDQVLERLTAAIGIFGPDKRLKFFNKPYADMWRLPVGLLEEQPTLSTLMETLRQKRQLPETSDFPAFKRDWEAMFTDLLEPTDFLLHLPDGRTLRAIVSPHPLGGLIFQFDDVTDRLALESTRQTLIAVQRSTLNAVFEGVCAFGRDGRLKLFNDAFVKLFGLDPEWLATEPHVNDVADATQSKLQAAEDIHGRRDGYVMTVLEPTRQSGRITMLDERVLEYAFVPLPDGQCLVLYLDVTDSTQVEEALRQRNRALENADLLKSRFISSMSYELRTPLNAIMGFAELLKLQAVGPLEARQQSYVEDILLAARYLADLIGDLLDLAALQAGYLDFEKQQTEFDPLMQEAIRTALDWIQADPARVDWSGETNAPVMLADPKRLHQAMRHLIVDALNYADPTAPILVSSGFGAEGSICLRITVPPPESDAQPWAERVLEPTGTAEPTDTRAPGADIGLSLFRALASAHQAVLTTDDDSASLVCHFPAVEAKEAAD